ncbi:uncharacterized protein LOC118558874 [Fundulus heteroclitus]|uniref:uncharacterized protein LOC118558874 n=1 Tax=Fundulus heteroclitus TaxID=8078 RepID=UPI00165CA8D3|nr:uncharacterized protein LOC118558874 [Fundulus heteroclitus]
MDKPLLSAEDKKNPPDNATNIEKGERAKTKEEETRKITGIRNLGANSEVPSDEDVVEQLGELGEFVLLEWDGGNGSQSPEESLSKSTSPEQSQEQTSNSWDYMPSMQSIPFRPRVKVYCFITGDTFGAHESIMAKVRNNRLFSPLVEETQGPEDSRVIVVFCPITSRVGSDVESAMRDQRVSSSDKPVILVLMHHTRDVDYSTGESNWSETYKDVVLAAHVFFHETEPGLLNCERNDQAIEEVKQKLHSYWEWYSLCFSTKPVSHMPCEVV